MHVIIVGTFSVYVVLSKFLVTVHIHSFIHSYSLISLYDTPQQTMIQVTLLIKRSEVGNRKESISTTTKLSRCLDIIWHIISTCL